MSAAADVEPKKSGFMGLIKKLLGFLLMIVVLVAAGFGAGWYYFAREISPADEVFRLIEQAGQAAEEENTGPERVARTPANEAFETSYFEFEDALTTNLRGSSHFLQLRIGVSTQYDEQVIANVETHTLALQSDILGVVARFTEAQLDEDGGREALANAIRDAINARLEEMEGFGGIENVFFTSFIRQ